MINLLLQWQCFLYSFSYYCSFLLLPWEPSRSLFPASLVHLCVCKGDFFFTVAFGTVPLSSWPHDRSQVCSSFSFAHLCISARLECYCYWINKLQVSSPFLPAEERTQDLVHGNMCYTTELEPWHFKFYY